MAPHRKSGVLVVSEGSGDGQVESTRSSPLVCGVLEGLVGFVLHVVQHGDTVMVNRRGAGGERISRDFGG